MSRSESRPSIGRLVAPGALIVLPGVVTLGVLGSLGTTPEGLDGFWAYPSGTIGDAFLLPALLLGLYIQLSVLPSGNPALERKLGVLGFFLGALGGAAVPASWILDADTAAIWLLPSPHHFNLAGWVHAIYLAVTSGALLALTSITFMRLRVARLRNGGSAGVFPGVMTVVVGAGLGMLELIGRDAVVGGATVASAMTVVALLVIATSFVAGFAWSAGPVRIAQIVKPGLLIASFLVGLTLLMVDWPPPCPAVVGLGSLSAFLGAVATSRLSGSSSSPYRWPLALAIGTLLSGSLARSVDAYDSGEALPLVWLFTGLILAAGLLALFASGRKEMWRSTWHISFIGYCLFLNYLAARLLLPGAEHSTAGASVGVADAAFDVMVFALIQARFGEWAQRDAEGFRGEYVRQGEAVEQWKRRTRREAVDYPASPMADVALLGFAVGLSLLTLLAVAAGPLGLNRGTAAPDAVRLLGIGAVVGVVALAALDRALTARRRRALKQPIACKGLVKLRLSRGFWLVPCTAAGLWAGTAVALSGGQKHLWALGLAVGAIVFAFTFNSLLKSAIVLNTLEPTRGQVAMCVWVALCLGVATFVFVCVGLWQGPDALPGSWLAASALLYFVGGSVVFICAGLALADGLPEQQRTRQVVLARQETERFLALDAVVIGLVVTIGIVIPLYAASRDYALHAATLNVVASMVFLPGLITGVVWGLRNWRVFDRAALSASASGVPMAVLERAEFDRADAERLEATRSDHLHRHLVWMRSSVIALMGLGLGYLVFVLLR